MNRRIAWGAALLLAALTVVFVRGCRRGESQPPPAPALVSEISRDDRIAFLLPPCTHPDPFLADTSDIVGVLVSKLAHGQLEPLRQAKTELAKMGPEVLPELRRFFDRAYVDALAAPLVINAIAVAGLMESDDGREILLDGLQHPQETVRLSAVRALRRHVRTQDYDRLVPMMPVAGPELALAIGQLAVLADRERFEADLLGWFAAGQFSNLWDELFPLIADTDRASTLERMSALVDRAEGVPAITMQTALARSGNAAARAILGGWLADAHPIRRLIAARAMDAAKLTAELAPLVVSDPDASVREFVARALSALPAAPDVQARLRVASGDADRSVRLTCLGALVLQSDDAAINEVLELLRGDKSDLEAALAILRQAWDKNPGLDERALSVLMRLRSGELQPVRADRLALDRALGEVPLRAAAEELYKSALETPGVIQGLRAHRWYLQQIGNVGVAGRQFARERWEAELLPERRMDLVMASSYDDSPEARAMLTHVLESDRSTPEELLYAAHLLVKIGPARTTAPFLKRVALGVADARIRTALDCVLWDWYGRDM